MAETVTTKAGAASKTAFGFVKVGDNIDVADGVISVTPSAIPIASATVLGGIKPSTGFSVQADGTTFVDEAWLRDSIALYLKTVLATATVNADGTLTFTI